MTEHKPDRRLDEQLLDVPLPDGMLGRLREGSAFSDKQIDRRLGDVPVQASLLNRWKQVAEDEWIDNRLRDVPLSLVVLPRCRIESRRLSRIRWARMAIAASLMMLLGSAFMVSIGGMLVSLRRQPMEQNTVQIAAAAPVELSMNYPELFEIVVEDRVESPERNALVDWGKVDLLDLAEHVSHGPAGRLADQLASGQIELDADLFVIYYGPLGYVDAGEDNIPVMEPSLPSPLTGIKPPLIRQFDRAFLFNRGENPIVAPASHPELIQSVVPLSSSTASFDLTRRLIAEGRLPDARQIRVEDFLAAMQYRFPLPGEGRLGIRTAAGPSLFGKPMGSLQPQLLQIGVQAGGVPKRRLRATHLTIALDVSASMRFGGRLEMARQALRGVIGQMREQDRLSLVIFNSEVVRLADRADRQNAERVLQLLEAVRAAGGTNLSGALQQSVSLAVTPPLRAGVARRFVLISDGAATLPADKIAKVKGLLSQAGRHGLGMRVIDLSDTAGLKDDIEAGDPVLSQLAEAMRADVLRAQSAAPIRWALLKTLTGRNAVVASETKLSIVFNPQAVFAYRLLGHEATVLGENAVEVEFRAGQAATALYELWLKPASPNHVATAVVTWRDPSSGKRRTLKQPISMVQFASTAAEMPLSLQAATIAAETAEILRQSYFCDVKTRNLGGVLNAAGQVNPLLLERAEFRRFVHFLEDIQETRRMPQKE